jgi:alpha-L-rhamnosidase
LKLFHWGNPRPAHPSGRFRIERKTPALHRLSAALALTFTVLPALSAAQTPPQPAAPTNAGPGHLEVDNLPNPLGIDDPAPRFSWQLDDPARGAKQSAYQILVASSSDRLLAGNGDVWDSGRVASSQSLDVAYAGPALSPSTRYFWRVTLWSAAGTPYAPSQPSWWETGLMSQSAQNENWQAQWIGYETPEEAAVRHAQAQWIMSPDAQALASEKSAERRFAYRTVIQLSKPVRSAALYATAQDTVSAWINGAPVLASSPLPPWKALPWRKFIRADVTHQLASGANTLALESVHYTENANGEANEDPPPLIATLFVQFADGAVATFSTNPEWKTAIHPAAGWQQPGFDAGAWKSALPFKPLDANATADLGHPWIPDSVKELRHVFSLDGPVKSARLYVTALGWYTMTLNDAPLDDAAQQWFAPGWTDYRERVIYQTYDVTDQINEQQPDGSTNTYSHVLTALLAPGWYSTALTWLQQPNVYGATPPALRAQLRIEHSDGRVEWITTDAHWQARTTGIVRAELYDGETEDRRKWGPPESNAIGSAADGWRNAQIVEPAPMKIVAQDFQPIRAERFPDDTTSLSAKSLTQPRPGVFVYDFGQNLTGAEIVNVAGPPGMQVRLRFAEVLNPDGTIYTDNLRTAKATDVFTLSEGNAGGANSFEPQFTFHGFRYAEVTGVPQDFLNTPIPTTPPTPAKDAVSAVVLHTDAPFTAKLTTGSPLINQLWSNILWGQRSNFVGVPTDCPQRDERLGWMGDAQVFWRAASYNMDLAAFSRKFAADMRGTQFDTPFYGIYSPGVFTPNAGHGAGWSDAGVIVPWTSWLQTGSTRIIEQNWDAMTKYLDAIAAANPGFLWQNDYGDPFGDWLSPEGKTDEVLIATAYWAYDVTLMRQMALATGRSAEAQTYAQLFEKIRSAFQEKFVHSDGFIAGADNTPSPFGQINNPNAKSTGGDTQTGYVLALHMNLVPENLRAAAAKHLAGKIHLNHDLLGTGFLGTPYVLEELTRAGYAQLAYTLLLNTRYPSWEYMVTHGATTMWERWNGDQMRDDPSMNSYNHYAYGAVADWIYRYAAGIDAMPADPGFHTVLLHPVFDPRLGSLSFDYDSSYGTIHSDWKIAGNTATWHITLPANTTGWLPLGADESTQYKLEGVPLAQSGLVTAAARQGQSGFELEPGTYTFTIALQ